MPLKLLFITNKPEIAKIAESNGADWIFVDLEVIGKELRQGEMDTVISRHTIDDIVAVKKVLSTAKLLVRINPLHPNSRQEIEQCVNNGADIVMLPFFKCKSEAAQFITLVNRKARACLLLETPEAVDQIDDILKLNGIDYIFIGLNDLHIGYEMKFMFEPLANGMVEKICTKIKAVGIPFGFGGIARLGEGMLPAEMVIAEHYRLGSQMVILSRSFCNSGNTADFGAIHNTFATGIKAIREYENTLSDMPASFFSDNQATVKRKVAEIVKLKS